MADTLTQLVTKWRLQLDDSQTPYLWGNDELTGYCNDAINELCVEIPALEDSTTTAIVQFTIAIGQGATAISPRITAVKSARLASQYMPLRIMSTLELDAVVSDWRNADDGPPQVFALYGTADGTWTLYPPSDAVDTLHLVVNRLPATDLVWATDSGNSPGVPERFQSFLMDGILYRAYMKQDVDTYDEKKSKNHYELWQKSKDRIARSLIKYRYTDKTVTPNFGFI